MADEKKLNEESVEPAEEYPFLKETFKDEQITGKAVWRSGLRMVGKGLIFGLAACIAFYAVKPWMDTWFAEDEEMITIPKDELEGLETQETEAEEPVTLTVENYREMNKALFEVASKSRACVVEISMSDESADWTAGEQDTVKVSGIIIWDGGSEVMILAPIGDLPHSGNFKVKFSNGTDYSAVCKWKDENIGFGIFTIPKSNISKATLNRLQVATWGNSYILGKGDPVISLGMQFGYSDGMGYGVISSTENKVTIADYQYGILTTDIAAASGSSGILFNVDGEVVGIVDQKSTDTVNANLVSAYAISEIKEAIELLSNGKAIPYLGIIGVEVPQNISEEEGIPMGLYVREVEPDSPAMQAGIQSGDIVVALDKTEIETQRAYSDALMDFSEGDSITIAVKRQGAAEYEDIKFNAIVGRK